MKAADGRADGQNRRRRHQVFGKALRNKIIIFLKKNENTAALVGSKRKLEGKNILSS